MASKFFFSFLILFLSLQFCTPIFTPTLRLIIFISAFPKRAPPIYMNCTVASYGFEAGSHTFKPVDIYRLNVAFVDTHYCRGVFGLKSASVRAYEPDRDQGHGTMFWKIDLYGFSFSYDNSTFKEVAPWKWK
ncbi:uncharacterized protein Fot_53123 [Forsythia ovata]|uniref:S-protein homolog n=1 Tax=Forsythia ovata TaxID=205694 RepID=A0ABD1PHX9_9LAMI